MGRALNHVELVYRPGERELAGKVFSLLGCRPHDSGGTFLTSFVEPDEGDLCNNAVYCSEVTPEQWELECALTSAIAGDGPVAGAARAYLDRLRGEPQRSTHFGIRVPTATASTRSSTACGTRPSTIPTSPGGCGCRPCSPQATRDR